MQKSRERNQNLVHQEFWKVQLLPSQIRTFNATMSKKDTVLPAVKTKSKEDESKKRKRSKDEKSVPAKEEFTLFGIVKDVELDDVFSKGVSLLSYSSICVVCAANPAARISRLLSLDLSNRPH